MVQICPLAAYSRVKVKLKSSQEQKLGLMTEAALKHRPLIHLNGAGLSAQVGGGQQGATA